MSVKWNEAADSIIRTMCKEGATRNGIANALNAKFNTTEYTYQSVRHRIEALELDKEGKESEITYIPVSEIMPHPDNPRKDYGDLTELTADIKANGIMQNLVLVPADNGYYALVGNRRLEASKRAGLEKVPCAIAYGLSNKEQVARMLAENMQRADLTPFEQAQGMQMMLDLGDTVDGISEKTGLSKSTIYRRINPLKEYGQDKVKKAFEQGATFGDFEKLNNISDPDKRQEVADKIGTNNFNFAYENACREEENQKKKQSIIEKLNTFAAEIKQGNVCYDDHKYIKTVYYSQEFEKPEDAGTVKYFYIVQSYGIELYCELTPEERESREQSQKDRKAREEQNKRAGEARGKFKQINETMYSLRKNFIKECSPLSGCTSQQAQLAVYKQLSGYFFKAYVNRWCVDDWCSEDNFMYNIGMETMEEIDEAVTDRQPEVILEYVCKKGNWEIKTLFAMLMAVVDNNDLCYYDWYGKYSPCPQLDFVYEVLCNFGYEMSDEEKAMQDGTYELFVKE